jgi:hypothetical protein
VLVLEKGVGANRVRLLTVSTILILIGVAEGSSSDFADSIRAFPVWFSLAILIDILLLVVYLGSGSEASWLESELAGIIFVSINIPVMLALFALFVGGIKNIFALEFWRELTAIMIALVVQASLVAKLRRSRPHGSLTNPGLVKKSILAAMHGLVPTSGACVFGFGLFLVFHLVAQSLLSDRTVVFVEEKASLLMERLEHPFGPRHRGIESWLIFTLLFAALIFLNRPRLTSGVVTVRKWESIGETMLLGFLCFTLASSQAEQFGIRREIKLADKATKRANAAYALKNEALNLSDDQKDKVRTALTSISYDKESNEVAVKAISHMLEDGNSYQDGGEQPQTPDDTKDTALSQLQQMKEKRIRLENEAEAATSALQEVFAQTSSHILSAVTANDSQTTELLVSAISDFISDNSEYSIKKVCARVVRVVSGQEKPSPSLPTISALVERSKDEVRESHSEGSKSRENDREVHPEVHPAR